MTRLFVKFYLGVLVVLFLAWYIYGQVYRERAGKELARVIEEAMGGGVRLVAETLSGVPAEQQKEMLNKLQENFDYPVKLLKTDELDASIQKRLAIPKTVVYGIESNSIYTALSNQQTAVCLGPLPNYDLYEIENAFEGWMSLIVDQLKENKEQPTEEVLAKFRTEYDFPISIVANQSLPEWPRFRLQEGGDDNETVFYGDSNTDEWFVVTPLENKDQLLRIGPLPNFKRTDQRAATTTLTLVLLPAALAILLLLRPVAQQLRHIEHAANAITKGNLGARVDERRVSSAKPLAQAFNAMADRTETMLRTQSELLQAVSHELRTPLARIRFAIDLIGSAENKAERRERLESLDTAAEELDALVGELLSYVRMETTDVGLEYEFVDVHDVTSLLIDKYSTLHPNIDISEESEDANGNLLISVDRRGFQRVLENLLGNASRFAERKVTICFSTTETSLVVDVHDDGCGINEEDRERVLQPFVRINEQPNNNRNGVGLGLALVQRIMNQHSGSLEILASPLGGCQIRTTWPTSSSPTSSSPTSQSKPEPEQETQSTR